MEKKKQGKDVKRKIKTNSKKDSKRVVNKNKIPKKIKITETKNAKKIQKEKRKKKNLPRASTGISPFDKMIQGGYDRDSINLVAGGSGSGKTIFALQFLLQGVKKDEKVLYVTFEEKKVEFYENMKKFGWDLDKLEKSGKFIFLEYSPEKVKMMLDEGGGSIESIVIKHKVKRLVIDSITSFTLLFETELEKRQAALGLFDIIRKWDITTMLTVQDDPIDKSSTALASIEFEADSITTLYFINLKGKRQRFIEVLKMRGTPHSKEIRSFEIKNGIKIGRKVNLKEII